METIHLNAQQIEDLSQLTYIALSTVDRCYGVSFSEVFPAMHVQLAYHNGHHARAVSRGAAAVGAAVELSKEACAVAKVAGAAHDIVQLKGRGVDEVESAAWLTEKLQTVEGLPEPVAKIGALAILGTEPTFENGAIVGQKATTMDYPSKLAELVTKSVASADLGELYTPQGPLLGHELYREIQRTAPSKIPPLDGLLHFQRDQVQLMHTYEYPLAAANDVLATHRHETTAYAEHVLKQLERGEIHTFDQLLAQDANFMLQQI